MSSRKQQYAEKQARKAQFAVDKELESGGDNFAGADADVRDAAMGKGGKKALPAQRVALSYSLACFFPGFRQVRILFSSSSSFFCF